MNNRQANGRRRGRGGQQQQRTGGGSNQRDNGNRIDSRARGNAAQLLEKYKNMARDAQMQGDRVNTEYYLQFADHYFRVLAETRSRFEENNPNQANQQPQRRPSTDLDDDDFDYEADGANRDEPRIDQPQQQQRDERGAREDRQQRDDRGDRQSRDDRGPREDRAAQGDRGDRYQRGDRNNDRYSRGGGANGDANGHANGNYRNEPQGEEFVAREGNRGNEGPRAEPGEEQPRRTRAPRPRREAMPEAEDSHAFDAAILPPALELTPAAEDAEEKPAPRRRGRPRKDAEAPAS